MYNAELENEKLVNRIKNPNVPIELTTYYDIFKAYINQSSESTVMADSTATSYITQRWIVDSNRVGRDYRKILMDPNTSTDAQLAQACYTECLKDERCFSWTYDQSFCWMKNAIPEQSKRKGSITGVIWDRFKCPKY